MSSFNYNRHWGVCCGVPFGDLATRNGDPQYEDLQPCIEASPVDVLNVNEHPLLEQTWLVGICFDLILHKVIAQSYWSHPWHLTISKVKAFLLYFLGGVRKGLRALGYRNLPELHEALEKEKHLPGDQLGGEAPDGSQQRSTSWVRLNQAPVS